MNPGLRVLTGDRRIRHGLGVGMLYQSQQCTYCTNTYTTYVPTVTFDEHREREGGGQPTELHTRVSLTASLHKLLYAWPRSADEGGSCTDKWTLLLTTLQIRFR